MNSLALDYTVDKMRPLYTVVKSSFKNVITILALYAKVPGRKALAVQNEATCRRQQTFGLPTTKATWE